MYAAIKKCLKNIFRIGTKTANVDNKTVTMRFLGKTEDAKVLAPWGLFVKTPADVSGAILRNENNEEDLYTILFDDTNVDELTGNIVFAMGIPTGTARIIFTDQGKILFKVGQITGGDYAVRFNQLKIAFDQLKSDFDNHAHTDASPGFSLVDSMAGAVSGSTGTPTAPSTADIDPAKIDDIEFPT